MKPDMNQEPEGHLEINKEDEEIIDLCKNPEKYTSVKGIHNILKEYYKQRYAVDPEEYEYEGFDVWKVPIFNRLLSAYMRTRENKEAMMSDILGVFNATFRKGFPIEDEEPIERAISKLFMQLQVTKTKEDDGNGNLKHRFVVTNIGNRI